MHSMVTDACRLTAAGSVIGPATGMVQMAPSRSIQSTRSRSRVRMARTPAGGTARLQGGRQALAVRTLSTPSPSRVHLALSPASDTAVSRADLLASAAHTRLTYSRSRAPLDRSPASGMDRLQAAVLVPGTRSDESRSRGRMQRSPGDVTAVSLAGCQVCRHRRRSQLQAAAASPRTASRRHSALPCSAWSSTRTTCYCCWPPASTGTHSTNTPGRA